MSVNLNRHTTTTVLMRLRTAANGPVGRVFVNASRQLYIRSDVAGQQLNTGFTLALGTWTRLELCSKTAADGYLPAEGGRRGRPAVDRQHGHGQRRCHRDR